MQYLLLVLVFFGDFDTSLGVKRLDDFHHVLPWQNLLHAGQENLFSGLTALTAEFTVGEGKLMTHDEPCSMAPDDKHDLISGTCSHLPYSELDQPVLVVPPPLKLSQTFRQ